MGQRQVGGQVNNGTQAGVVRLGANQRASIPNALGNKSNSAGKTAAPVQRQAVVAPVAPVAPVQAAAPAVVAAPAIVVEASTLVGNWEMSKKEGDEVQSIMQLTVETDGSATLRTQTRGQEPKEVKGTFALDKNILTLVDGELKLVLGEITAVPSDKLLIKQDSGTLTFSKSDT